MAVYDRARATGRGIEVAPVLVLDMYEHAYHMDFGTNATACIDTFFRSIKWDAVLKRIEVARADASPPNADASTEELPSVSVEQLADQIAGGSGVQMYCSYGFDIGRNVTRTRVARVEAARYLRGGLAAWYAAGGARALRPTAG